MPLRLQYFARVREAIGLESEERELPAEVRTIAECVDWLTALGEPYASAFADRARLRFALDRAMAPESTPLALAGELAIFPPVTGG
jgi:sulfur-carrier protein